MILDLLQSASNYSFANPRLHTGLEFLRSARAGSMAPGRLEIDGERLFAMKQQYPTRSESDCFWEAHRKYIDIQFVMEGVEDIAYSPIDLLREIEPYDPGRDLAKFDGIGSRLTLSTGMFAIFFPHDGHMPCLASRGTSAPITKIVVKALVI